MVDDNIFVKDFLLKEIIEALDRNPRAIGFSLRLGRNTGYCYMQGRDQSLPPFNDAGEEFGEERLIKALEAHRQLPPEAIIAAIVEQVKQFSPHEQHDDITLIVGQCRRD